eukprot:9522670-Heterocapsa_arctica.AAC.2
MGGMGGSGGICIGGIAAAWVGGAAAVARQGRRRHGRLKRLSGRGSGMGAACGMGRGGGMNRSCETRPARPSAQEKYGIVI